MGDVIEFAYLWSHERQAGRVEAVKDRRCVIVAVLDKGARVMVVPITGTDPGDVPKVSLGGGAVGLKRPSWIVPTDINVTDWPGHDLRRAADPRGAFWRHGQLSPAKRQELADAVLAAVSASGAAITPR